MDIKKLSKFIIALGIVILTVGAIKLVINQPQKYTPSERNGFADALQGNIDPRWQVADANMIAQIEREKATKIMIAGGVILFIGIGVFASAKKS